jgi:hypothetical protein
MLVYAKDAKEGYSVLFSVKTAETIDNGLRPEIKILASNLTVGSADQNRALAEKMASSPRFAPYFGGVVVRVWVVPTLDLYPEELREVLSGE